MTFRPTRDSRDGRYHPRPRPRIAQTMAQRPLILVVEDDALVAEVVVDALAESFDVSPAEDAAAAVERLRRGGVAVILLDCTLPKGLGEELIPTADAAGIPIVLMSGNPDQATQIPGKRPFVLKPFALDDLVATVERALPPAPS